MRNIEKNYQHTERRFRFADVECEGLLSRPTRGIERDHSESPEWKVDVHILRQNYAKLRRISWRFCSVFDDLKIASLCLLRNSNQNGVSFTVKFAICFQLYLMKYSLKTEFEIRDRQRLNNSDQPYTHCKCKSVNLLLFWRNGIYNRPQLEKYTNARTYG